MSLPPCLLLLTRILLQRHNPIKNDLLRPVRPTLLILTKVRHAHPLEPRRLPPIRRTTSISIRSIPRKKRRPRPARPDIMEANIQQRIREPLQRLRIDIGLEVRWVRRVEQRVEQARLGLQRALVGGRVGEPVDVGFWFGEFGPRRGDVVGGVDGGDEVGGRVGFEGGGGYRVGYAEEADGGAEGETEEIGGRGFAEIAAFDEDGFGEGDFVGL